MFKYNFPSKLEQKVTATKVMTLLIISLIVIPILKCKTWIANPGQDTSKMTPKGLQEQGLLYMTKLISFILRL